jgi:hypothetical protein
VRSTDTRVVGTEVVSGVGVARGRLVAGLVEDRFHSGRSAEPTIESAPRGVFGFGWVAALKRLVETRGVPATPTVGS